MVRFWRYYLDDSIHSFYPPGSDEEAEVFQVPWWLSDQGARRVASMKPVPFAPAVCTPTWREAWRAVGHHRVSVERPNQIPSKTRSESMNLFKHNMGKTDRIIRVILGVLLIGNVFFALQHPIGWIGVILILTGIFGICPLYSLLNINTKSAAEKVGLK